MYPVAIVAVRHMDWNTDAEAQRHRIIQDPVLETLLDRLISEHGPKLIVVGMSSDKPFGQAVKAYCNAHRVNYIEPVIFRFGEFGAAENIVINLARHSMLLELCSEFHVFISKTRATYIEDLVYRAKEARKKVRVYAVNGEVIEDTFPSGFAGAS